MLNARFLGPHGQPPIVNWDVMDKITTESADQELSKLRSPCVIWATLETSMKRIATKILMALAAVAVPALAVAGVLGWMLITTVQEVGSDVEAALSTQRRIGKIRVLMEKESGLVFRLPVRAGSGKSRLSMRPGLAELAKDDRRRDRRAGRQPPRRFTPEMMKSIGGNRAEAKQHHRQDHRSRPRALRRRSPLSSPAGRSRPA